jgi:predicted esterase
VKENYIEIQKTANYYTLGELNEQTQEVFFILHGYGELASGFLEKFNPIMNGHRFIIAPEALNKFYLRGVRGKIGASWMTSKDRSNDIKTNLAYFDKVYEAVMKNKFLNNIKIRLLGFSQGGETACRWFASTKKRIDELILWGGKVPPTDINIEAFIARLNTPLTIIVGNEDRFITPEILKKQIELLEENKIEYRLKKYSGRHDILPEYFRQISFF